MYNGKKVAVVVAAAGSSRRMGGRDKQYIELNGIPVLARSVKAFQAHEAVDEIVITVKKGEESRCRRDIVEKYNFSKVSSVIAGGEERYDSVKRALAEIGGDVDLILIHDGARPFVTSALIGGIIEAADRFGAAVPGSKIVDTVKIADGTKVKSTPSRESLRAIHTPQGFRAELIRKAYQMISDRACDASGDGGNAGIRGECGNGNGDGGNAGCGAGGGVTDPFAGITDDASVAEACGYEVSIVEDEPGNIKITAPEDVERALFMMKKKDDMTTRSGGARFGIGYDVHAFAEDRDLILGGVKIPYGRGLAGHSDADVLVHAIMDAILGAAALGDIGRHFPDNDDRYKGISSLKLLDHTGNLLKSYGYEIVNIDAVVIAQEPKIAPFIERMRANIASTLGIDTSQVNIKGTTTEHLGFEGRKEGIASQAVASVISA